MKKLLSLAITVLFCTTTVVCAKIQNEGIGFDIGYKAVSIYADSSHATHSDDSFLSGDAGKTEVGLGHYVAIGGSYRVLLSDNWAVNLGVGGLIGYNRDESQNDNDSRPASSGSFIYSESIWGAYGTLGVEYAFSESWYVGIESQIVGAYVEHGWDRWGSDQGESSEFAIVPTVGPKIGYMIWNGYSVEATVQIGAEGIGGGIAAVITF